MNTSSCLAGLIAMILSSTAGVSAADWKIAIKAGKQDRSGSIVHFAVSDPSLAGKLLQLTTKAGSAAMAQVDAGGQAVFIERQLAKGETKEYSVQVANKVESVNAIHVAKGDRTLEFTASGKPFFTYQMQPGDVPAGVPEIFKHGAHLHPIFSPSGKLVTGNHPADHRWHRGIWMAWTHTEFDGQQPDFWNMGKSDGKGPDQLLAEVRFEALEKSWEGPVQGGFISTHRFIDHNSGTARNVLNETWEIAATPLTSHDKAVHVIDFISTQICADNKPVKLPKYHYGGLGVRGNAAWDLVDKVTMLTSNGDDRKKGDSTKAKWVHMGGEVDGQPTGMVVLIHPDNFRFPQPLRLNPKNPQLCIAPSQDGDWSIEPGKPYISKYRILIVDGKPDADWLEAQWRDYAEPATAAVTK